MTEAVLDASAVLAFINDEPGSDIVARALSGSAVSAVNVTEIATRLLDRGVPAEGIRDLVVKLPCEIVNFDDVAAFDAAELREKTRRFGLSLGDRACLALAHRLGVPAFTAGRHWTKIDVGVEVRLIRR